VLIHSFQCHLHWAIRQTCKLNGKKPFRIRQYRTGRMSISLGGGEFAMQVVPDGGFSVDLAELGGVAGQIGVAYDDLTTAISQYGQETPSAGDFGSQVAGSWSDFDGAWAQELNVLGLAITEMASKIHTVGTNYSTADSANVRNIDGVAG
jgi:hypothetical protein